MGPRLWGPLPFGGELLLGAREAPEMLNTWLILPVIICLSQRLSHARVSTGLHTVKLRMAH